MFWFRLTQIVTGAWWITKKKLPEFLEEAPVSFFSALLIVSVVLLLNLYSKKKKQLKEI